MNLILPALAGVSVLTAIVVVGTRLADRPIESTASLQAVQPHHSWRLKPPSSGRPGEHGPSPLEEVPQEEISVKLGKTVAAWNGDHLSESVPDVFTKQAEGTSSEALRLALLRRWAAQNPTGAAAWAESLTLEADRAAAFDQIILAWSAVDAQAALDWLKSLPDGPARVQAWTTLAYEISRDDPAKGFDLAISLAGDPDGGRCLEHAVSNWALQDPQAVWIRVKELPDAALRESALICLATSWAESDPSTAATLAAQSMEPGTAQDRAVASIVQRWAQQDRAAVEAWIASFPESLLKQNINKLVSEQAPAIHAEN